MIIYKRRKGESLFIGDQIRLIIIGKQGRYVKLKIEAPKNIPIYREEIIKFFHEKNHYQEESTLEEKGSLIIKRKAKEAIIINNNIRIEILELEKNMVVIGVQAP